ncbi:3-oxo-5-alpha-steroid 4-dehydrogenase C-terminal [Trinorchestia longiramus]|nr:3-oxo-5-alpha-steroid 4-dehydrogenase C-terminal [Trinorchestia longiramus]
MDSSIGAILLAINWPAAFYLASVGVIVILEPISVSSSPWLPDRLKKAVQALLGFGKTLPVKNSNNSWWIKYMTVPKSWFRHFYVVSASIGLLSCALLLSVYWGHADPPRWIVAGLDHFTSASRQPGDSSLLYITSVVLLTLQCCARLTECYYVSIFSSTARMNLVQYGVGFAHYICAYSVLLAHTPALVSGGNRMMEVRAEDALYCFVCYAVFAAAFLLQRDSLSKLANLRRAAQTRGSTSSYILPIGGGFEYVSCPHMCAEVLMYTVLVALVRNPAAAIMWLFVFTNQVHVALSNHRWYRSTFPDYPLNRRAIFPALL